ncbi:hypothetical protein [Salinispora arenicola]|uniref:Uncharacterized protein n=1 Tax=Salinispora arenicola (strain CNS-205) TaxID=391037 RepID=A8LWL2_SALAI|nr:hypothetical protein [Salinispora arenicola]
MFDPLRLDDALLGSDDGRTALRAPRPTHADDFWPWFVVLAVGTRAAGAVFGTRARDEQARVG